MIKYLKTAVTFLGLIMIAGCLLLPNRIHDIKDERSALVYGSIQGIKMDFIHLHKVGKIYIGNWNKPRPHIYKDGTFFFENIEPGEYYIDSLQYGKYIFDFGFIAKTIKFTVKPGELHYVGSFEVTDIKDYLIGLGKFTIKRVDTPDRKTLLERIMLITKGTGWESRIRSKIQ